MVEEPRQATKLNHAGFAHGLLHDQIQDLAHRNAGGAVRVVDVRGVDDELAVLVND